MANIKKLFTIKISNMNLNYKIFSIINLCLTTIIFCGCTEKEDVILNSLFINNTPYFSVKMIKAENIKNSSVDIKYNAIFLNFSDSLESGIVLNYQTKPDLINNCKNVKKYINETSEIILTANSLKPNTEYYVRAYIIKRDSIIFSEEITVKTIENTDWDVNPKIINSNTSNSNFNFEIINKGTSDLEWELSSDVDWLNIDIKSGITKLKSIIDIYYNKSKFQNFGINTGHITINSKNRGMKIIEINIDNIINNDYPILLQPDNNSVTNDLSPTFLWKSDSKPNYYQIQIALDKQFLNIVVDKNGILQSNFTNPNNLNKNQYWWRVKSFFNGGESTWSEVFTFTINLLDQGEVPIGSQVWMSKNLDVDHYRNGDPIPQITDSVEWASLNTGAWCYYNNDPTNGVIYCKLYNWYAVNDPRGLAPSGYHVPSDAEWTTLSTYLGGENLAGGKMKETGTTHWESPNTGANNSSGFSGLSGGFRYINGKYISMRYYGIWWSATEYDTTNAWNRVLSFDGTNINRGGSYKVDGAPVRCVRD